MNANAGAAPEETSRCGGAPAGSKWQVGGLMVLYRSTQRGSTSRTSVAPQPPELRVSVSLLASFKTPVYFPKCSTYLPATSPTHLAVHLKTVAQTSGGRMRGSKQNRSSRGHRASRDQQKTSMTTHYISMLKPQMPMLTLGPHQIAQTSPLQSPAADSLRQSVPSRTAPLSIAAAQKHNM